MKNKIAIALVILLTIVTACKKDNKNVSQLTSHYIFKPGTYWVYKDRVIDSMYVAANGESGGLQYMQINDVVKGQIGSYPNTRDTVYTNTTIYIGIGPISNQLQIWGYNFNGNSTPQVIFEADTPTLGAAVAQACVYAGITNMSSHVPQGVPGTPLKFGVNYSQSNKNQAYGNIYYYFYPDYGIVQIEAYNTPWGDQYFNLVRSHIIQ